MNRIMKRIEKRSSLNWEASNFLKSKDYEMTIETHMRMKINSRVCFNIAMLYMHLNNYEMASFYFLSSVNLDPWLSVAYYFFALLFQKQNDYNRAIKLYNKCRASMRNHISIDYTLLSLPLVLHHADVIKNTAVCYYRCGLPKEARKCIFRQFKETIHELLLLPPKHDNMLFLFKRAH